MLPSLEPELNVSEARSVLETEFFRRAEWRRRRAEQVPQEAARNFEAARLLEKLASSLDEVPDELMKLFALHWGAGEDGSGNIAKLEEEVRRVGFSMSPKDATEFVKVFTEAAL